MKLMKTILRKIIAIIVAGWGVIDWGLSTKGIEVYSDIGINLPVWIASFTPMIAFVIAAFIWVGIPKDEEEKNENY